MTSRVPLSKNSYFIILDFPLGFSTLVIPKCLKAWNTYIARKSWCILKLTHWPIGCFTVGWFRNPNSWKSMVAISGPKIQGIFKANPSKACANRTNPPSSLVESHAHRYGGYCPYCPLGMWDIHGYPPSSNPPQRKPIGMGEMHWIHSTATPKRPFPKPLPQNLGKAEGWRFYDILWISGSESYCAILCMELDWSMSNTVAAVRTILF